LGVAVFGVLWYRFVMRWSEPDDTVRRWAAAHWRIDRHFDRRVRRGQITKEQWIEEAIPQLRKGSRSWQRPLMFFWIAFGIFIAVQGAIN
jgi:hypothetical protein